MRDFIKHPLPAFPTAIFPKPIREYIESASTLNFPLDFVGAAMLPALSIAIGASFELAVNDNWREPPMLFVALIGDAGVRKSPSLGYAIRAIRDRQREQAKVFENASKDYRELLRRAKAEREPQALPEPPQAKQTVVEDATVEALITLLSQNRRGVLNYRDELASWTLDLNRYRAGSDEQRWLSIWSAGAITYNRKTQSSLFVERPIVSVLGGMQPAVLGELFNHGKSENGFSDRILFAYPDPIKRCVVRGNVPPIVVERYKKVFDRLFALEPLIEEEGEYAPHLLRLDEEARAVFEHWNEEFVNRRINDPNTLSREKGVLSKLEAYTLRFALILHMTAYVCGDEPSSEWVSATSMHKAIRLTDYFKANYEKITSTISPVPDADKVIDWIRLKEGPVTKRDIYRAKVGGLDTEAKATAFIQEQVGLGILVAYDIPQERGGRPQTVVELLI
jgi:hypothetical protein